MTDPNETIRLIVEGFKEPHREPIRKMLVDSFKLGGLMVVSRLNGLEYEAGWKKHERLGHWLGTAKIVMDSRNGVFTP